MGSASGDKNLGTAGRRVEPGERPPGAPPDQEEPRVPQPGLFHFGRETTGFPPNALPSGIAARRPLFASRRAKPGSGGGRE